MERLARKENPLFHFWKILWTLCFCTVIFSIIVGFFSLNTGYTGMTPAAICLFLALAAAVVLPLYTLPAYFAYRKQMPGRKGLLMGNLLLGWTVVGYIVCAAKVYKAK